MLELLVVVGIILLLAAMTAAAVNLNANTDKVRGASRQIQTYLAGARDRAIYGKAPRGVRFLLDPTNNRTVSSLVYIQETAPWTEGAIQIERLDLDNDGTADDTASTNPLGLVVRGYFQNDPTNSSAPACHWVDLFERGMLSNGAIIEFANGDKYTVTTELLASAKVSPYYPPRLHLTTAINEPSTNPTATAVPAFVPPNPKFLNYKLYLPPSVMPNAQPVLLPRGSVVHLDRCTSPLKVDTQPAERGDKLPSAWKRIPITPPEPASTDPSGFDYTGQMDIMFSPRGVVTGSAAQRGIIHLYVGEQKDADRDRQIYWPTNAVSAPEYGALADKYERGDKLILSVFTRTGSVSSHPVHPTDTFRFAETGEVAGK